VIPCDGRVVDARLVRDHDGCGRAVETHAEEVSAGRLGSSKDDGLAPLVVDRDQLAQPEVRRRQLTEQRAVAGTKLQLRLAVALGPPDERAAVVEPVRDVLVQVQPGRIGLSQQRHRAAGRRIRRQQDFLGLRPVLDQQRQRRIARPADGRKVGIAAGIPVDPDRRAAHGGNDAQTYGRVRRAGPRVRPDMGRPGRVHSIEDVQALDRSGIRLLVRDGPAIRRPPVALETAHLFLSDELAEAIRDLRTAALRQAQFAPVRS
jgi:hypothetical protein